MNQSDQQSQNSQRLPEGNQVMSNANVEPNPPATYPQIVIHKAPPSATASLVLGIVSILCMLGFVGVLTAPVAIILGHKARKQIRTYELPGKGMATTGLILGYTVVGLTVVTGLGALFA